MKKMILNILNVFIPKGNIISFSSFPDYADNARTLSEYISANQKEYDMEEFKIIWHVNDEKNFRENNKKIVYVKKKSLKSIYYFMRSKYIFSTHGLYNIIKTTKNQKVCLLWHGMPLKKIGYLYEEDRKRGVQKADFYFVTSELFKKVYCQVFRAMPSQIYITGQPRNDELFTKDNCVIQKIRENFGNNFVMYLPTYRKSNIRNTVDGENDKDKIYGGTFSEWEKIDAILNRIDKKIVIKPHPMEADVKGLQGLKNVILIDDEWIRVNNLTLYKILSQSESLITDYSSVFVDYLLLNNPILFFIHDIKSYQDMRGFIFDDIKEILPGKIIDSFMEIGDFITEEDIYDTKREKINQLFNEITDSSACENIIKNVISLNSATEGER